MFVIDNVLVSDDLAQKVFHCDLEACKGACCVEGDDGAIVAENETATLDDIYDDIKDYITQEGRAVVEKEGKYVVNNEGNLRTPLIDGKACAYVQYENGISLCGIEKAWLDGKTHFRKPVSCHLYPIRINKVGEHDAMNYERWEICSDACKLGEKLGMPVYKFLKEAIVRKYGEEFYAALDATIEYEKSSKQTG